jgi:hypothetical protein
MENGTIGEARTRSLLLDRFWVLERSVDLEGADFIIMRRHTRRSLLDPVPPRLGFVQVKFFESDNTTAHIHEEYVISPDGKPRPEFFVIAHTGHEAEARMFFLPAEEIVRLFPLKDGDSGRSFALRGKDMLADANRAPSPNVVLDVIERALERADLGHNREFMLWALPSTRNDTQPLPERYAAPLPIENADLTGSFDDLKSAAEASIFRIDEVREPLVKIANSNDPLEAFSIAEELKLQHTGGHGTYISFDPGYDEESHRHWLAYSELHDFLVEKGLLLAVAELRRRFELKVSESLLSVIDDRDVCVTIEYGIQDLSVRDISVTRVEHVAEKGCQIEPLFRVVRVAVNQVQLVWHGPSHLRCWKHGAAERSITECRDCLIGYAKNGLAVVLEDIVRTNFPDAAFDYYF